MAVLPSKFLLTNSLYSSYDDRFLSPSIRTVIVATAVVVVPIDVDVRWQIVLASRDT